MKKRLIPVLLLLCICLMLLPVKAEAATSGSCGNGVYFSFSESTGLLKIYGSGDMWDFQYNYGYSSAPWWEYVANIKKIEIGSGVTRIGNTAFNGCWNAESITIPETVTSIGSRAFYGCTALTSITIPSKVTAIENYTFYRTSITEIDLPDGITSLGVGAFADSCLTSIDIPAGVTTINSILFSECSNLEKVTIRGNITNIGEKAFYNTGLKELVFEGTLSGTIGDHAFAYCENLPSFHVPGTVTRIEAYAFCGCEGMTELILEEGITSIGDSAFRETGISTLTIPSTVTYFGGRIADFADNLKNVTMYTPTVEICKTWILNMRDLDYVHIIGDAPQTTVEVFSSTSQATDFVVYYDEGTSGWEGDTWNGYKIKMWGKSEPTAKFTTISTSLGGNIAMNFYLELSEDLVADPEAYIQFTYAGRTLNVPLSEGVLSDGVYRFSCPITSKNMTDDITAQVYNAAGPVGDSKTMDVATYCNWVIANYTDAKTVNLMKAMLNYGASAQLLFKYRTDDLANAALSDADKVLGKVDASAYIHSRTGEEEGIKPDNYTLLLDSETTVRVYFKLTGDKTIDEYTFTVDGVEVEPKYKDGLYYIEKQNISAHRLDDLHTFTCGDITITYGGLSYVNQVMTYYESGATFDMASALYAYSMAAEAYIG